mmetsp:Transcript_21353/g.42414  ORF Transcript_21353/g.42414 Transcript_21353/m.42414 type:complete len:81 (-) Transcript_21353:222-464(-)
MSNDLNVPTTNSLDLPAHVTLLRVILSLHSVKKRSRTEWSNEEGKRPNVHDDRAVQKSVEGLQRRLPHAPEEEQGRTAKK